MALSTGSTLGVYEVVSLLGSGGMGEVYRARDTKLGRAVAIKVLPEAFAFDPDRVARFEREAKVLASLNHPHIAALHGMEVFEGRHFLIMELVEGETLADRLARSSGPKGPPLHSSGRSAGSSDPAIPIEDTLKIAIQIADALEAAHEKGVIHRDLKPANVKITPDDKVKVLDFGLAKAMSPADGPAKAGHYVPGEAGADRRVRLQPDLTASPTLSMMATQAGMILGTAAYMSPEQAKGLPADRRSDVFSFGGVLYEMLTGRQPFQGDTTPDILASVLAREPDLAALPANLNPRLSELLRRCLDKHPKRRWQAVGDLRAELESIAASPRSAPTTAAGLAPPRPLWRRAIPVALAALVASALTGAVAWYLRPAPPLATITRFPFTLADGQGFSGTGRRMLAIAPDGAQMVYGANQRLYVRSMSDLEARPIPGTEGSPQNPVFSPDGRSVAFWANGAIRRIAVTGGAAVTICPADAVWGMSWDADGIVFGQGAKGIMRVSANGGRPEVLVAVKGEEQAHGPQMLPDGEHVLFTLATGTGADRWDRAQVVGHSLRSGERKILIEGGSDAQYVPTGHIAYALAGTAFAVPFNLRRLEVTGGPVPVVEGVRRSQGAASGAANVTFSDTGSLIYIPGPASTLASQMDIAVMDRKGGVEPLKLPPGAYDFPRVSPDGRQIAFGSDDAREAIVLIYDLSGTGAMRRLTFGGKNRYPIWSADGARVAFQSDRESDLGIFWQLADGTGTAERLTKSDQGTSHIPDSWSPNGDTLLFSVTTGSNMSLWTYSVRDRKTAPFGGVRSTLPITALFSPNGRWVAYQSNERGAVTIYLQPFPATGARYQIPLSGAGGNAHHPLWSRDGKELFYIPRIGGFEVVSVSTQPTVTFGNPVPVPRRFPSAANSVPRTFDITPDGRIVAVIPSGQTESGAPAVPQIQVVLNWFEELKTRVPVP